jgi:hypothetical protein
LRSGAADKRYSLGVMKYFLRSCYLSNTHEEAIDSDRFNVIKSSRRVLTAAFEVEEIFDNLISNYLEVESRCLELTARRLVRQSVGYREGNETLSAINLVFVNYLSTARAYVDKIGQATSRCFEGLDVEKTSKKVKSLLAEQFDMTFGFRFMEALRNHVQHSGSALHTLSQGNRKIRIEGQQETISESFLEPFCSKNRLKERGGFKAKVLHECPDTINLLESARSHVQGLSRVHRAVRDIISAQVAGAALNVKAAQSLLEGKVTGSLDSTEAISVKPDHELDEKVPLLLHWEDVRAWLVQRNPGVSDGIQTYPSGRVVPQ